MTRECDFICENQAKPALFYVMRLQNVDTKDMPDPTPSKTGVICKDSQKIRMFGSLGGGGEYGKHHVSHHVATPKLYDLGDANAHRYVPP